MNKQKPNEAAEIFSIMSDTINGANFDDLCDAAHRIVHIAGYRKQEWISVDEQLPDEFVSVLGYMTDAGEFPAVRECYMVGKAFFFPALKDAHPVSHWMPLPEAPKMKGGK